MSTEQEKGLTAEFQRRLRGERLMKELLKPRAKNGRTGDEFCNVEKVLRLIPLADLGVRSNLVRMTPVKYADEIVQTLRSTPVPGIPRPGNTEATIALIEKAKSAVKGDGDPADTLLITAVRRKQTEITAALLPRVDPNETNNAGERPVTVALEESAKPGDMAAREEIAVRLILDPRTELQGVTDALGHKLLVLAVNNGMHKAVDALLERRVDPCEVSEIRTGGKVTGHTYALMWAGDNGDAAMIRKLCARGADPAQVDETLEAVRARIRHKSGTPTTLAQLGEAAEALEDAKKTLALKAPAPSAVPGLKG